MFNVVRYSAVFWSCPSSALFYSWTFSSFLTIFNRSLWFLASFRSLRTRVYIVYYYPFSLYPNSAFQFQMTASVTGGSEDGRLSVNSTEDRDNPGSSKSGKGRILYCRKCEGHGEKVGTRISSYQNRRTYLGNSEKPFSDLPLHSVRM